MNIEPEKFMEIIHARDSGIRASERLRVAAECAEIADANPNNAAAAIRARFEVKP